MRSMRFNNELFHSLSNVLDILYETISQITKDMVMRITYKYRIFDC